MQLIAGLLGAKRKQRKDGEANKENEVMSTFRQPFHRYRTFITTTGRKVPTQTEAFNLFLGLISCALRIKIEEMNLIPRSLLRVFLFSTQQPVNTRH